jgi:hypothetical protein
MKIFRTSTSIVLAIYIPTVCKPWLIQFFVCVQLWTCNSGLQLFCVLLLYSIVADRFYFRKNNNYTFPTLYSLQKYSDDHFLNRQISIKAHWYHLCDIFNGRWLTRKCLFHSRSSEAILQPALVNKRMHVEFLSSYAWGHSNITCL